MGKNILWSVKTSFEVWDVLYGTQNSQQKLYVYKISKHNLFIIEEVWDHVSRFFHIPENLFRKQSWKISSRTTGIRTRDHLFTGHMC